MTFNKKMPVQVKVVLAILWLESFFGVFLIVALLRKIQVAGVRNLVEIIFTLTFLFVIYANYRLGAGSRWAYRYILFATSLAIAKFILNIALNKSIAPFQFVGFGLNVTVILLLMTSATEAFYQRRN